MILLKLLLPVMSFAFTPKPATILQKLTENNGSGAYVIEQEVQFPAQPESVLLKETWTIANENHMKLVVTGLKDLKNQIHLEYVYESGTRSQIKPGGKQDHHPLDENFIEKYFHIRKADHYGNMLTQMKVLTPALLQSKPYKKGDEPEIIDDPHLRLARVGGTIAYALGLPEELGAEVSTEPSANFFIEQDSFILRKFHLKSQVEVSADQYAIYSRGLSFPKLRTVKWLSQQGAAQVTMHTLRVLPKTEKGLAMTLESSRELSAELGPIKTLIEEFYSRFR